MNKVAVVRAEKNISQLALAQKCGVSQQTISFIESERRQPSLTVARKIAVALGSTIDDLFP